MKKILFLMTFVCAVLNVSAQKDSNFSWKAGVGLANLAGSEAGVKSAISFKLGVGYDFAISESFSIEPAAMLNNKGFKIEGFSGYVARYFLEVPVMAAYKMNLNDNCQLVINAGPYVAYGLFGSDIEWSNSDKTNVFDACNRFEAGVGAGAKVVFERVSVGVDFNRAFTKAFDDVKAYSQVIGLTFGYNF
jgi:hypothetical protein